MFLRSPSGTSFSSPLVAKVSTFLLTGTDSPVRAASSTFMLAHSIIRESAGTQFCFIQGKVWNDEELDGIEKRINNTRRNWLYYVFQSRLKKQHPELADEANADELHMQTSLMLEDTLAQLQPMVIPEEHRQVYRTIGGSPHLDGSVTIFGEVVEGLDIVEKISLVETDKNDRPLQDVIVLKTKVFQK